MDIRRAEAESMDGAAIRESGGFWAVFSVWDWPAGTAGRYGMDWDFPF